MSDKCGAGGLAFREWGGGGASRGGGSEAKGHGSGNYSVMTGQIGRADKRKLTAKNRISLALFDLSPSIYPR